jgi:hypothetical protein
MMSAREIELAPSLRLAETPDFEAVVGLTPVPLAASALLPVDPIEEEPSEAALPTAVLDRRSGFTAELRPGGHVGPYAVESVLVKAPGASIYTARTMDGTRILLQVARLRAVVSKAERVERLYIERRLASLTRLEIEPILSHGGADEANGQRVIFWALPLPQGALALRQERRRDLEGVLRTARALAHRLVVRHDDRLADPLLTESLIYGDAPETTSVLGVSLVAPGEWLAADMAPRRAAPEETVGGAPLASGDLYRLGQTIATLAAPLSHVPPMLTVLVSQLSDPRPEGRGTAGEAVAGLDALIDAMIPPPMIGVGAAATVAMSGDEPEATISAFADEPNVFEIAFAPSSAVPATSFEAPKLAPDPNFTAEAAAMALWLVSRPASAPKPERLRTAVRAGAILEERQPGAPRSHKTPTPVVTLKPVVSKPVTPPPSAVISRMTAPALRDEQPMTDEILVEEDEPTPSSVKKKMLLGMAIALLAGIALGVLTTLSVT